jgi:16S rRNA (cytidine1402-2'-O)-methyltransferase
MATSSTTVVMANPTQNPASVPEPVFKPLESLKPGLYLVATPIGNLRDITLRALDILNAVDRIACEDTRVSARLLQTYDIKKPLFPYHDHNADTQRPKLIEKIQNGERIALISDAGMPLISDPGYKLVRACQEAGLYVTSLPGANAPLMALQLSGLPTDSFSFLGFLPAKAKARRDMLGLWEQSPSPLILFESANRLEESLEDIQAVLGDRPCTVLRELTKLFEDVWPGNISDHLARLKEQGAPKGEIVIVVGGYEAAENEYDIDALLKQEMERVSLREAVDTVMEITGLSRKSIYDRALKLK